jgi:AraC family transcriptional regulator, exoenzyme S synthesis regulatory protein ExsA
MLKILPQSSYQDSKITKVLVDGLSCIVHKQLGEPVLQKEGYVSTDAITPVLKVFSAPKLMKALQSRSMKKK